MTAWIFIGGGAVTAILMAWEGTSDLRKWLDKRAERDDEHGEGGAAEVVPGMPVDRAAMGRVRGPVARAGRRPWCRWR